MRFKEFKLVEQKLFEANRGIIGTVIDTQGGRGASFTKPDGTVVQAVNAWKFPIEETERRYEPVADTQTDPAENGSAVGTATISADQQFEEELKQATKMDVKTIKWVGGQKPSTGFAALVIELQSDKGKEWVGKYFGSKKADGHIFWQVSQFVKEVKTVGIDLEQKRAAGSTGTSGNVNFGPYQVGVTNRVISLNSLVDEVKRGVQQKIDPADQNTLVELLENLGGAQTTINPEYKANYEVQFGEVAAPLAITRGINVTGSIQAAEEQLLGLLDPGTKFTSITQAEFPEDIAEKLVDSYLITPNGSKVGVSSKDKKGGAAASISSIIETINNKLDVIKERVPDFETRYADYISRLRVIEKSTGKNVAFNLAVDMGIISQQTATAAYDLLVSDPGNVEALQSIGNGGYYETTVNWDGYNPKTDHPMYRVSYHAAASLARIVAAEFNKDKQQTYSFFATVLESSNMIQVMTTLSAKGDQAAFTKFDVIYPPVFDGDIKLEAGSYFFATKPPQGFTFKIK